MIQNSEKTFASLGLSEPLLRALTAEGYTAPTPIQAGVIPALLTGADILGIAQTGTGKTASYVLPILHRLATTGQRAEARGCRALILVPTRELANQVADSIRTYGRFMSGSLAVVVGGASPRPQIQALARGVDIVIATPGRLEDHMSTGAARLEGTEIVVLDEADQMLDIGFMPAIRRILPKLSKNRQTVLLSATMPKPIRDLARDFQRQPVEISVAPAAKPIERITQSVLHLDAAEKRTALSAVLRGPGVERAMVFTRTKRGADKVSQHLQTSGFSTAVIHGNKSQGQRERALELFRAGRVMVLVATDIAARGIDIDDVSHVINYELPNVPESYVHRIGRTARAGKGGIAISLCDASERGCLRDIERLTGQRIPVDPASTAPAPAAREMRGNEPAGGARGGFPPKQHRGATRGNHRGGFRRSRSARAA